MRLENVHLTRVPVLIGPQQMTTAEVEVFGDGGRIKIEIQDLAVASNLLRRIFGDPQFHALTFGFMSTTEEDNVRE